MTLPTGHCHSANEIGADGYIRCAHTRENSSQRSRTSWSRGLPYFASAPAPLSSAAEVLRSSVLHILHGNRSYALSRRSHPVTPFAPTGPTHYRPLVSHLVERLNRIVPELRALQNSSLVGEVHATDFRDLRIDPVDAVITSPPFAHSLRFWSSNWMRLWFAGWDPASFVSEPPRYLETQQRSPYEPYRDFADSMKRLLKPKGLLIMHLGETANANMVDPVIPTIGPDW